MAHKTYLNKITKTLFKMQNRLIIEYELVLKKKTLLEMHRENTQRNYSRLC